MAMQAAASVSGFVVVIFVSLLCGLVLRSESAPTNDRTAARQPAAAAGYPRDM
jgi:hypothetical protein